VTQLVFVRVQTDKSAKVTPELLAFPIYRRLHEGGEVLKKRDGREKKNGRKELVIVDVVVWGKTAGAESGGCEGGGVFTLFYVPVLGTPGCFHGDSVVDTPTES
jgi:hypothetical protein